MLQIFVKGGAIMWPLLVLSVLSLSVVIERLIFFIKESNSSDAKILQEMSSCCRNGQIKQAAELGAKSKDRVARVVSQGLENGENAFEEAISAATMQELISYESGLPLLDTAITLAPLLGLLGTVTGMIKSFGLLGAAELDAPVAITGGIAEALIATAFGLGIAICALIPFNMLQTKKEQFIRSVETKATIFQAILKQNNSEQAPRKVA